MPDATSLPISEQAAKTKMLSSGKDPTKGVFSIIMHSYFETFDKYFCLPSTELVEICLLLSRKKGKNNNLSPK